ncbi:pseudoephedrine dehydrogenase [Arthrobacter sp. TS-15]|uniref:Pseudoephedrine dehydrogenase n=2 Tax=Arthrobacter TaxID=1663 RepID=A0ACD6BAL6_9MICC|nr:SDR family oxidoreductase [Arthrobacter sp. TS-15]TQS88919.1 pseudoephedrine dehydrogenase [Arthrobacter sp. TS-15]
MINMRNRVAIVTGGAMGMGNGCARKLAEAGAKVYLIDRSNLVAAAAQDMREAGLNANHVQVDITDQESLTSAYDGIAAESGRLDVLVNAAGVGDSRMFLDVDDAHYKKVIDVNVRGTWNSCRAAVPHMLSNKHGRIINFGSISGPIVADPGWTVYALSKGAIFGFTKALASEFAGQNILVNAILPGSMDTPMMRAAAADTNPADPQSVIDEIAAAVPLKRLGTIDDAGNLALFLASDLASYLTGQAIVLDGAFTLAEYQSGGLEAPAETPALVN